MIVSYVHNYVHACILLLILVFYVLAQYEMLVFCNPLSKCPSATPFLFLLARTQYYFFMDKTKQFLYVFVDIVNTSCSMEPTIVIWFLFMVTVTVLQKKTKINGRFIDNVGNMFMGTRKQLIFGSIDCYHHRHFFCNSLTKHSNIVLLLFYVTKGEQANERSFIKYEARP